MRSRLILGTAGLGGIAYGNKWVSAEAAADIIRHAYDSGITSFDTAPAYGDAETILGNTLLGKPATIFTKTTGDVAQALRSVRRLGNPHFLWHNYRPKWWQFWPTKLPDWVDGVTVYSTELPFVPRNAQYVQVEWNLLRQTKYPPRGAILRSVFGRGRGTLTGNEFRRSFALRAALEQPGIEGVVVGCMSKAEVDECVKIANGASMDVSLRDLIPSMDCGGTNPDTDPRTT